jgi:hypothetical protein
MKMNLKNFMKMNKYIQMYLDIDLFEIEFLVNYTY